jgi:hypothetical protein
MNEWLYWLGWVFLLALAAATAWLGVLARVADHE